jgi:hypothetical protein
VRNQKKLQEESQRYEELSEKFDHFQTEAEFERGNARNEIQRFKDIATEVCQIWTACARFVISPFPSHLLSLTLSLECTAH